jgi:hypothetical protein
VPLQNRVDPFGEIHAVAARGTFTGNRGVIHDPETRRLLARRWTTRAWIICDCAYGGRKRAVMGRNTQSGNAGWTELFFLDEPTALSAGHRPCFFCRREKAVTFARCFAAGQGRETVSAPEMDAILHGERLASGGKAVRLDADQTDTLPDGAMVASGNDAWAVRDGMARKWSFAGYGAPIALGTLPDSELSVLTPVATLAVLRAGYRPVWNGGPAA